MPDKLRVESFPKSIVELSINESRLWRLDNKPKNIYIASRLQAALETLKFALQLQDSGFTVTSSWLRTKHEGRPSMPNAYIRGNPPDWQSFKEDQSHWGSVDLADLERSDTLLLLSQEPSSSGGYHVELGYFLGAKKTNIIVVGTRWNVFFWAKDVRWCPNTDGLVEWLQDSSHGLIGNLQSDGGRCEGSGEWSSGLTLPEQQRILNLGNDELNRLRAVADAAKKLQKKLCKVCGRTHQISEATTTYLGDHAYDPNG